ncbi:hypothetical protein RHMOL_Rhmol09G0217800 [Rhododendron molle]|uniref:Uncharacterized protein n=1 Tax=Rhododendron molle TaxID=49168 RepID=A0ACC0MG00_RHOML|nr:hypothetical protein RHMOL_Rhmol09G0217800 [Rhododendron molle]
MASLPYADVDSSLRALAGRAEGFGRFAVGGLRGPLYSVTTLADDGPGSLREGCRKKEPLWIVFEVSGTIHLSSYLNVSSYKTIDGRGHGVKLTDPSHVGDRCVRVTIHHCFFDGTRQRHPRLRFGKVHLYNNYTRNWGIYAVCASVESQIYSQCNIYEAGQKKKTFEYYTEKAADKEEAKSGLIRSEGDLFLKGAQACLLTGAGNECMFHPTEFYPTWTMETASDSLKAVLQVCSGWQSLARPEEQRAVA